MISKATAVIFVTFVLVTSPAMADQIAGEWCPPGGGRSLLVKGHADVMFGGQPVQAKVDRHHVDFAIPPGGANAGEKFNADQLSDEQIRVTIGTGKPEIWTPCKPVS